MTNYKVREDRTFQRLRHAALQRGYRYVRCWVTVDGKPHREHELEPVKGRGKPLLFNSEAEVYSWLVENGYHSREPYIPRDTDQLRIGQQVPDGQG